MGNPNFKVAPTKVATQATEQAPGVQGIAAADDTNDISEEAPEILEIKLVPNRASFTFTVPVDIVEEVEPVAHFSNNNVHLRFKGTITDDTLCYIADNVSGKIPGLYANVWTGDIHAVRLTMTEQGGTVHVVSPSLGRYIVYVTWFRAETNIPRGTLKRFQPADHDQDNCPGRGLDGAGNGIRNGAGADNGGDPPRG
jgi:hypothetical protein